MRFDELLRIVLEQETGYKQPSAPAPYVRTRGGAYWDGKSLVWPDGRKSSLPRKPDGMAYDDDPNDTGGRTCMGVIQRVYDGHRRRQGRPVQDVWLISDEDVTEIYRTQYYDPMRIDELPPGVALVTFDAGVNTGITAGAKRLQEVLGVTVDGHIGSATIDRARYFDYGDVVVRLTARRVRYYKALRTYWAHGKAWLSRAERIKKIALARIEAAPSEPIPEPERTPQATPVAEKPIEGIDTGTTVAIGGGGAAGAAAQVAVAAKTAPAGSTWGDLLLHVASEPMFWIGIATLLGAAYTYLRRRRIRDVLDI